MSQTLHAMCRRWATPIAVAALALALVSSAMPAAGRQPEARKHKPEAIVVERPGFRWRDAAIGAMAGMGLVFAIAGAVVVFHTRRPPERSPGGW